MKKLFALFFVSATLLWGCKKDDTPAAKTKSDLIARNWQFQTASVTLGTIPVTAYTKGGGAGNLVDFSSSYMNFKSDKSFSQVILPGTTTTGTWKFNTGETAFILTSSSGSVDTWTLDNLTETNLNFSRQIAGNSTDPSDQSWLALIKSYGFSTANGAKIEVKAIPNP
ncbi:MULTISPECIES: hypothetical protein [unclassified Spirosoma]|uniref:hypothetical protein n=1 Tax=unclassified Spirosoma TaxID=2621999 RepID=UPI00095F7CDA|nr:MULTISPECIES: hypothetical protein [unclassified Spirosoma]MBN8825792.1 hypothetical protein [Spirosoma sp.]OJW74384.1 MAG: hypothetical protein BGO59_19340 [Spirosoma sp. 48-14]